METGLQQFIRYLRFENGYSPSTVEAYRFDLERGLIPFLYQQGKSEVEKVTRDDIRAYLDYTAVCRGNSSITRARKLAAIKSFFNYLVGNGEIEVNPAAQIRSPRIPEREPVYLTDDETICLLRTIAREAMPEVRERDTATVILFRHAGLRVSELINLELANVDLESRRIKVTRKGNKEQYLPLNRETAAALAGYLARRPQSANGTFFVQKNGRSLTRSCVYDLMCRYLELAGISKGKRGPHILRHTFCTRLHQKGVDSFTIKELAGHRHLNTTMRYVKIENKEQTEAIDRLEMGFFSGTTNESGRVRAAARKNGTRRR
jgi:site-specific recombinase XerD